MEASPLARRAPLGTLKPGHVSARRAVPEHIARPEYMFHDGPERVTTSDIKSPETIARIREAGRIAAGAIEAVGAAIAPGVTTDELDRIGHEYLLAHDAYPSCLGYMGFPKSICSSINEVICHGIPDDRPLEDGDAGTSGPPTPSTSFRSAFGTASPWRRVVCPRFFQAIDNGELRWRLT